MSSLLPAIAQSKTSITQNVSSTQAFNWDAWTEDVESEQKDCKFCNDPDYQDHDDIITCIKCGSVLERLLDMGAEYRFFSNDDKGGGDPCRVGAPIDQRLPDSGLGTIILGYGQGGHASARSTMMRIKRFHTWSMFPYKKRSLLAVFEAMTLAATNYGIEGRVIDMAKDLYLDLVEHCEKRGLSRTSVIASCIYSALKMIGAPRKPKDVADMFHLQNAQFTKAFKDFQCVLAMAKQKGMLSSTTVIPSQLKTTHAADYIALPLSKLEVARTDMEMLRASSIKIAEVAESEELSNENMPPSLASAVITYVLHRCGYDKISPSVIAVACDVSEGTLMKCLRRLEQADTMLRTHLPSNHRLRAEPPYHRLGAEPPYPKTNDSKE
jgi:transcription initiation factor TFIIIB Brf1 subunit/transcription initiation factor TFIIB